MPTPSLPWDYTMNQTPQPWLHGSISWDPHNCLKCHWYPHFNAERPGAQGHWAARPASQGPVNNGQDSHSDLSAPKASTNFPFCLAGLREMKKESKKRSSTSQTQRVLSDPGVVILSCSERKERDRKQARCDLLSCQETFFSEKCTFLGINML